MSSVKLSTSGERGYSLSVAPEATSLWSPTRQGDDVRVTLGSLGDTAFVLPRNATIEVVKRGTAENAHELLLVRLPGPVGLTIYGLYRETTASQGHPHMDADVRKHHDDVFASYTDVVRAFAVESLFSPTEE